MRDPGRNTWTFYEPAADGSDLLPSAPFDALTDPSVEDLLPAGLSFWPRGAAWGTPDGQAAGTGTVLAGFTRALLAPFADLYRRAWLLTQESRALTLMDSLTDWEADYGLPDACSPDPSEAARRRALLTRVRAVATITPQDFIQLARQEGFDIAIEEPALFECGFSECGGAHTVGDRLQEVYWIVHVYGLAVDYFTCGESECGHDPLFAVAEVERLQCLFARLAPGWTQPVYVVHEQTGAEGLLESFESGLAFDFIDETYASRVEGEPDLSATGPWHQAPGLSFSRGSSAYRTNASGVMESVASGVLRFDHDPVTFAPKGALVEGARTNLFLNSVFANSGGVAPTNFAQAIGGGTSAPVTSTVNPAVSAYTQAASAERPFFAQSGFTFSANTTYAVSLEIEAVTGALIASDMLRFSVVPSGGAVSWPACPANPTGGAAGSLTVGRLVMIGAIGATAGGGSVYVGLGCGGNVTGSARFSMPQVEVGPNDTSFIATTTATAARAADLLSVPSAGLVGLTGGTMYAEGKTSAWAIVGNNGLIQLDDGTSANRITLYQLGGADRRMALYIASGGVASVNQAIGTSIPLGSVVRVALTWSGSSVLVSINGGTPISFTGVAIPAVTTCRIGGGGTPGSVSWWGVVAKSALLPRSFSSAELQALSA